MPARSGLSEVDDGGREEKRSKRYRLELPDWDSSLLSLALSLRTSTDSVDMSAPHPLIWGRAGANQATGTLGEHHPYLWPVT